MDAGGKRSSDYVGKKYIYFKKTYAYVFMRAFSHFDKSFIH